MRYLALATDYDGTLAEDGHVSEATLAALRRWRERGGKLVLVTGRELDDLLRVFPDFAVFDRIVAENGALLFCPETREQRALVEPPPEALLQRLAAKHVQPLSSGRVIVATWSPNEQVVLDTIRELGLELQVIFNKGAVMVLPSGVNKASGLRHALAELSLSTHNVVAVGDAENDHALLAECEFGAAVANALPMLKQRADWVTASARGRGVCELIEGMLASDLSAFDPSRHHLLLGHRADDTPVVLRPYGQRVLVCGASGSGKSTLATAFLERLVEQHYQYCLIDPEGDFEALPGTLELGDHETPPKPDDAVAVLRSVDTSLLVNLGGVPLERRPQCMTQLFARLSELRASLGRPHWFVVDEAHHMLPAGDVNTAEQLEHTASGWMLITVHPDKLAQRVLEQIDTLIVVGREPAETLRMFTRALGRPLPTLDDHADLEANQVLLWNCRDESAPVRFRPEAPKSERRRHHRKYAAGSLGEDKSFYFRGPERKLQLRAQNLMLFLQIGAGVDDATWLHHLHQGDYSTWVRTAIKNDPLATEIEAIERSTGASAGDTRESIREAIERVYTLPS